MFCDRMQHFTTFFEDSSGQARCKLAYFSVVDGILSPTMKDDPGVNDEGFRLTHLFSIEIKKAQLYNKICRIRKI